MEKKKNPTLQIKKIETLAKIGNSSSRRGFEIERKLLIEESLRIYSTI